MATTGRVDLEIFFLFVSQTATKPVPILIAHLLLDIVMAIFLI
jgi:hypothetical protein